MKKTIILLAVLLSSVANYSQEAAENKEEITITTYYLIRHAEKKIEEKDPEINNQGIERTKKWLAIFKNISFDAVYSTDYKRTKQTAKPIADANKLAILGYNPKNLYDAGFKYNTAGKTVLIVGHSNTTPSFANKILGKIKYKQIEEKTYGNLYIVTVIGENASSSLLNLE